MTATTAFTSALDAGLIFAAHTRAVGDDTRALRRDAEHGHLVRVARGVYIASAQWGSLFAAEKYRLTLLAMAQNMQQNAIFSHHSAAALLGISLLGDWPRVVSTTIAPGSGTHSTGRVRRVRAALDDSETAEIMGLRCTSPARTVADLARELPFAEAVAAADSALHRKRGHTLLTLEELATQVERMGPVRGHRQLCRVTAFATPLSDSVRESESRALIHLLGFPAPILQQPWWDGRGFIGETDFWWPAYRVAGEFDGLVKYLDHGMRGNRTAEQVVVAEKKREDRIRRLGQTMARWVTEDLVRPALLRTILLDAGLPLLHAR